MIYKFLYCSKLLRRLQNKMKNQFIMKQGKMEVLKNYWSKLTSRLQKRAIELNDMQTDEICKKICQVPKEVKNYMLKYYIDQC